MRIQYLSTWIAFLLASGSEGRNDDRFNFNGTIDNPSGNGKDYGPEDWGKVSCDRLGTCLGFPDTWRGALEPIHWAPDTNICLWCPDTGNSCGLHQQSPINLNRDKAIPGHVNEKICPDWHRMKYEDGACSWEDLVDNKKGAVHANNFFIQRHALQILTPLTDNGELACENDDGRIYPRIDYSKGFPDFFHLSHTEITVPSVHTQEGKRYDAEVHLAHFYEIDDIDKNKLGSVSLFLEAFEDVPHFEFLDKLICQWRESEDVVRTECKLRSVPEYPGCRNPMRGRTASPTSIETMSTGAPVVSAAPVASTGPAFTTDAPVDSTSAPVSSTAPLATLIAATSALNTTDAPIDIQAPTAAPTLNVSESRGEPVVNLSSPFTSPPVIECNLNINFDPICQSGGCCDLTPNSSDICSAFYGYFATSSFSACFYCCDKAKAVVPPTRRLRGGDSTLSISHAGLDDNHYSKKAIPPNLLRPNKPSSVAYDVNNHFGSAENVNTRLLRLKVEESNRKGFTENDDDFDARMKHWRELAEMTEEERNKRRLLNYDHVAYSAYEWMLAVKTEYYFRYEGSHTTPPCSQVVHWRVMKDPIQVNRVQIKELERLLTWRRAPKGSEFNECRGDTAGRVRTTRNGTAVNVDLNRPLQSKTSIHRTVFCECQDWRSKFIEDNRWCRRGTNTRLYSHPYWFGNGTSNETAF